MKKLIIYYFLFCILFFSLFSSGFVDSQDGFQYLAVARRMVYDKTFALPEENFPESNVFLTSDLGNENKRYSPTGLGYTLALIPSVLIESIFLKFADIEPISAFPLSADWPVLLFASFTNSIFAALLCVTMYFIFKSYKINHRNSIFLSFITLIATNLFPYSKHTMAHMMQISFFVLTFYNLRKYLITGNSKYTYVSGLSFGISLLAYNPTFVYPVIPFGVYYMIKKGFKFNSIFFLNLFKDLLIFSIGVLPFVLIYYWFNWVRFGNATSTGYGDTDFLFFLLPPAKFIYEGLWSTLLSPGRSFFLYSPILVSIFLLWHKLKKGLVPEIIAFFLLFVIYVYLTSVLRGGPDYPVWHGESSWGPRYLTPLIPFLMILIGNIFVSSSKQIKKFVFLPLIILGIYIQILGILLPYQLKFGGLQSDVFFNERNFNVYEYGNQIPRYSPIFKMTKTLVKRLQGIPNQFDHGSYDLRLLDGFNAPFDTGFGVWREIMPFATINLYPEKNLEKVDLKIANHQIDPKSKKGLEITVYVDGQPSSHNKLKIGEEKIIRLDFTTLKIDGNVQISFKTNFLGSSDLTLKNKQVVFLKEIKINGDIQNISTIDYPYISPVSKSLFKINYNYWGLIESDPWEIWHMHSRVYENTFDLWWLRPFHYWDLPKTFFGSLFLTNILGVYYFALKTLKTKST